MSTLEERLEHLCAENKAIGWPKRIQELPVNLHGWFREGNRNMLQRFLASKDMHCIIELGSWLGRSTKFICDKAPSALVFAADIWSNQYFLSDDHYDKSDTRFAAILEKPIYDQFLCNLATHRYRTDNTISTEEETRGVGIGLIPMQMRSLDAIKILHELKIEPDLIYIDASHHYDYVVDDVTTCMDYFPNAIIVGDDWDNTEVKRAVLDVAKDRKKSIQVEGGSCWTFHKQEYMQLVAKEQAELAKKAVAQTKKRSLTEALAEQKAKRNKASSSTSTSEAQASTSGDTNNDSNTNSNSSNNEVQVTSYEVM